jgi:protein-disulfide isomerase
MRLLGALTQKWAIGFVLILPLCIYVLAGDGRKAPNQTTVATVGGNAITEEDLHQAASADLEDLELQRLQFEASYVRGQHQVLESTLARLIEGKILAAEARKRGVSEDSLLNEELKGKWAKPSPLDVTSYYETNKQRIGRPLDAQLQTQIEQFLENQNYKKAKDEFVNRLRKDYGVQVLLEPLRMTVETKGSPSRGSEDAPVTLVEFSDFQCPYCAAMEKTLRQVEAQYGPRVRLVYVNFPLTQIHPNAERAAEAAVCAGDQGHFWEMHDLMFQDQTQLQDDAILAKAAKIPLDMTAFRSCLNSGSPKERIKKDMREGAVLGVSGTPALFINGRFLPGVQPIANLAMIIDQELESQSHQKAEKATVVLPAPVSSVSVKK